MSTAWLATVVDWAVNVIGVSVIIGGMLLAGRLLVEAWLSGNRQISDRFGVAPHEPAERVHPVDRVAAEPKPTVDPASHSPEGRGLYGGVQ